MEYVGFPWATLIDLERRSKMDRAAELREKLHEFGPRKTLVRATVCQHIWAPDILEDLHKLKITDLFWCHADIQRTEIEGIRIHPFPLYPVAFEDRIESKGLKSRPSMAKRTYLYSFAGAYDPNLYLTPARQWIFHLPERDDAILLRRSEWHFDKRVYDEQIENQDRDTTAAMIEEEQANEYRLLLEASTFSLCPSGAGPNSIRLWESLGAGAIPVLISDTLRLPGPKDIWTNAIVRVPEDQTAIADLPKLLEQLADRPEQIERMRANGAKIWSNLIVEGPKNLLGALSNREFLSTLI